MMHCNNVVVALVDDNKRPIREHDSKRLGSSPSLRSKGFQTGRSCKILMPFESEFKILVKNQNNCRVKLDITIDGAKVSGNGLILNSHSSDYVERSVDVSQKFKFVHANHEDVADPTNEENGNIVVTVWKEKVPVYKHSPDRLPYWVNDQPVQPLTWNKGYNPHSNDVGSDISYSQKMTSNCSCENKPINNILSGLRSFSSITGEEGAVIDGGYSDQNFGSTYWNGNDDSGTKFIFFVRGIDHTYNEEVQKELELLAKLKDKYES